MTIWLWGMFALMASSRCAQTAFALCLAGRVGQRTATTVGNFHLGESFPSLAHLTKSTLTTSSDCARSGKQTRLFSGASSPPISKYRHTLAILTTPSTSWDRIANEAILETSLRATQPSGRLSIVLRSNAGLSSVQPTLSQLRGYVGEVYSTVWDDAIGSDDDDPETHPGGRGFTSTGELMDAIVYPQNLPNAAPEQWIYHRPTLDCVCSHDSICGWISESASGTGVSYSNVNGDGMGGLDAHVAAINLDRTGRGLPDVDALHVDPWPAGATAPQQSKEETDAEGTVVFLEDEEYGGDTAALKLTEAQTVSEGLSDGNGGGIIGGTRIPSQSLFQSVAVGGTFDGMHYGHRKLLTLAVSSVYPATGKLLVGVTVDDMLRHKSYAELIPPLQERIDGVWDFVGSLAPGMKNRIRVVPISDAYGPPGSLDGSKRYNFDALVLSHETLDTGKELNRHRVRDLGLDPLVLLCTRRTEPHGMSSTALRRMRSLGKNRSGSGARVV